MNEQWRAKRSVALATLLLAAVLLVHVSAVILRADREPHLDETEYLHAGWMMRNGERLYETFFEHHSPYLFATLAAIAPEGEIVPAKPYFVRARWLAGAAGMIALLALGATLWRVGPEAPAMAVALILATGTLWFRGFADVRAEPFAMACFLAGSALVLSCRGIASGLGLSLVAAASLWNPKWPIASIAIGLIFLVREFRNARSWISLLIGSTFAFGAIRLIVPFDLWWFFNFDVNLALSREVQNSQWALDRFFAGGVPFLFVPDAFHPWLVGPAAVVVAIGLVVRPALDRGWPLLLLTAALIELRFFLPWPAIWSHYYLMWAVASAAVFAVVPRSIEIVLRRVATERLAVAARVTVALTGGILAAAHVLAVSPVSGDRAPYWVKEAYFRKRLRPGDLVWLEPPRHPVTVRDAHYYWFSVGQMVRAADTLRQTARGRRYLPPTDDLPTCVPPERLRYSLDPRKHDLVEASQCLERLIESGRARSTVFEDVWELRLLESEADPLAWKGTE